MAESGIEWAVWEPDFVDQFGDKWIWLGIGAAALVAIGVVFYGANRGTQPEDQQAGA
jgi:hypothetical protein